jgi:hypothetical protein
MKKDFVCTTLFCFSFLSNYVGAEVIIGDNASRCITVCNMGAAWFITRKLPCVRNVQSNSTKNTIIMGAILVSGLISDYFLTKLTIEGKLNLIETVLEDLSTHILLSKTFDSIEDFNKFLTTKYLSLHEAKYNIDYLLEKIRNLLALMTKIKKKATISPLYTRYKKYEEELNRIMNNFDDILSKFTEIEKEDEAKATLKKIKSNFNEIESYELYSQKFKGHESLMQYINATFSSEWPLVDAKKTMNCLYTKLEYINQYIEELFEDVDKKDESLLAKKLFSFKERSIVANKNIISIIDIITNHPNYQQQFLSYQKHNEEEANRTEVRRKREQDFELEKMKEQRRIAEMQQQMFQARSLRSL